MGARGLPIRIRMMLPRCNACGGNAPPGVVVCMRLHAAPSCAGPRHRSCGAAAGRRQTRPAAPACPVQGGAGARQAGGGVRAADSRRQQHVQGEFWHALHTAVRRQQPTPGSVHEHRGWGAAPQAANVRWTFEPCFPTAPPPPDCPCSRFRFYALALGLDATPGWPPACTHLLASAVGTPSSIPRRPAPAT